MDKRLNGLVHWDRYFREATCAILLLLVSLQPAFSATKPDGTIEITNRKEQFMSTLASMPYTSSGAGPVLYVLECSTCPSSQAFEKDWKGRLDGVEIRRLFIGMNATTANETAYLARTRDINDFYAFMNHTKVAPKIKSCNCPQDNVAIRAFNSVAEPLGKVLVPTMIQNDWRKNASPPQFIWQTDGRVFVSGYAKGSFHKILNMLRSGTHTKEASVPTPQPAASDSALNDSLAAETTGQFLSAEKNSPKPAGDAPASNGESKSGRNGGSGPDVLGLHIGTMPAEARSIFKSHGYPTVSTKSPNRGIEVYQEDLKPLAFTLPGRNRQAIPSTNHVSKIVADFHEDMTGPEAERSYHRLIVLFSPLPGHEGVVSVSRQENLAARKKPTFEAFSKTLNEKYGSPTEWRSDLPGQYRWRYDGNGTLRTQTPSTSFVNCPRPMFEAIMAIDSWLESPFTIEQFRKSFSEMDGCGSILVEVILGFDGVRYTGPGTLIRSYSTLMIGYDAIIRGFESGKAIIDKAQAEANAEAIKKGQQQKPDL